MRGSVDEPAPFRQLRELVQSDVIHSSVGDAWIASFAICDRLMLRRFGRACEMLADPLLGITAITHACGFASLHRTAAFCRGFGVTPSTWRRERLS